MFFLNMYFLVCIYLGSVLLYYTSAYQHRHRINHIIIYMGKNRDKNCPFPYKMYVNNLLSSFLFSPRFQRSYNLYGQK